MIGNHVGRVGKLEILESGDVDIQDMTRDPCNFKGTHLAWNDMTWTPTNDFIETKMQGNDFCIQIDDHFSIFRDELTYWDAQKTCKKYGFELPSSLDNLDLGNYKVISNIFILNF